MWKMLLVLLFSFQVFADEPVKTASIYDANLGQWTDESGQKVNLNSLKGKKVVTAMVYTSCQMACPMMVKKLKKIERALQAKKVDADFLVISFDAKFDTPEKLRSFRKHHEVSDPRWHTLVGSEKNTRFFSNLLEIRFSRNPKDLTISHDNKVVFLDEEGKIVGTSDGLDFDPEEKMYNEGK